MCIMYIDGTHTYMETHIYMYIHLKCYISFLDKIKFKTKKDYKNDYYIKVKFQFVRKVVVLSFPYT